MKFFEIFDTGSFLEQGSQSIVWLTSIHLALTVLFYFSLVWLGFLGLQLVEDGSKISLLPLLSWLVLKGPEPLRARQSSPQSAMAAP